MRRIHGAAGIFAIVVAGAVACGGSSSGGATAGSAQVKPQSGSTAAAAVVSTHASPAGTYLTDAKGMTLYLWKADTGSTSTCSGACAQAWAPYTTSGMPQAKGGAQQSMLATSKRGDGSTQVTYAGHPLYYYAGDTNPGDMNGQGSTQFGSAWWVVNPNGSAITASSKGSGGSPSSSPSKSSYSWG
jgi:predicted lipoprotein with Yx(FWY)xxD motif